MITVVRIDNPFEPHRRESVDVAFKRGMTTKDICQKLSVDDVVAGAVAHNGERLKDGSSRELSDGDFVTIIICPAGQAIAALSFWEALFFSYVVGTIASALMPKLDMDENPDSNYGYYGFQNTYLPEGSPVPLVYGSIRTAAPCINQSIMGGGAGVFTGETQTASYETLTTLLAISEGPISGLGDLTGRVSNSTQQSNIVNGRDIASSIGLLVNGIDATALEGTYSWRTGELDQTAMSGNVSSLDIDTSSVSNSYVIKQTITIGTDGILGTSSEFPPGVVSYANRIIESDSTQFTSLQLTEKASLANVQFFFARGLYSGGNDGTPNNQAVNMRVQYWATDISGTATSSVYITQPINITEAINRPFSVDHKLELWDADTITSSSQGGYLHTYTQNYALRRFWLRLTEPQGLALCAGSSSIYGGGWIKNIDQNDSSYQSFNLHLFSWSDDDALGNSSVRANFEGAWAPSSATVSSTKGWTTGWQGWSPSDNKKGRFFFIAWDNGKMTRWVSPLFSGGEGNTNVFPGGTVNNGWGHYGFSFNNGNAPLYEPEVTFYWNGIAYAGERQYTTETVGWGHVRPSYPTDGAVFSIGNFLNKYAPDNGSSGSDKPHLSSANYLQGVFLFSGQQGEGLGIGPFMAAMATAVDYESLKPNMLPSVFEASPDALVLYDMFSPQGAPAVGDEAKEYYRNYALPSSSTEEYQGVHHVFQSAASLTDGQNPTVGAPNSGTALWTKTGGEPSKGYYKIEVFKDKGTGPYDTTDRQDTVQVETVTTFNEQEFVYPGTALLSAAITGTDQISNSQPELTALVHGILVPVWDGDDEAAPTITREFNSNPAWIALDLLTNRRYGMGDIFSPNGTYELLDLHSFKEWADFCDAGVADGFGQLSVFGVNFQGTTSFSDDDVGEGIWLHIGLIDTNGVLVQSIPETWQVGNFVSITSSSGGHGQDWKTSDDAVGGLNNASNLLKIHKITPHYSDEADGFHGWRSYVRVDIIKNRPNYGSWDQFWADDAGVGTYSTDITETLTSTDETLKVEDVSVFSTLDYANRPQYATITSGSYTETVRIYGYDDENDQVHVYRAQLGTTAVTGSAYAVTISVVPSIAAVSGYERRCRYDGVLDKKNTAGWDALLEVFQAGRAMPVKAGAKIVVVVDKPKDPVALFGQGNIKEGSFSLAYLSAESSPNSITVRYLDSDHNFEGRTVIIDHPSTHGNAGVCSIGGITDKETCELAGGTWTDDGSSPTSYSTLRNESLEAKGVVRRSQATRDATYRLNRYHLQRRSATFEVGPDAIHLLPGDRILVSHDTPQYGFSGRIPEAGTIASNLWPSGGPTTEVAPSLYQSMGTPGDGGTGGGPLWRGTQTVMTVFQPEAVVPPLTAYSQNQLPDGKGVAMFRGTPMNSAGTVPAGAAADGTPIPCFDHNKGGTGSYATWAIQFGYPGDGAIKDHGVDLDVIASATHKSCFSVYVREPAKGATRGVLVNVYRRYDEDMGGTSRSYYGYFRWIGGDSHRGEFRRRNNAVSR